MKSKKNKKKVIGRAILKFYLEGRKEAQYGIGVVTDMIFYKHIHRGSANIAIIDAGEWGPDDAAMLDRLKVFLEIER